MVATTTGKAKAHQQARCDLLENTYLCGSNNNSGKIEEIEPLVVICLKIRTFVVATTTFNEIGSTSVCCDLLENTYLCGSNNNFNEIC